MSEEKFWKQISKAIGNTGHFSRVESPQTSAGIPDVDFCIRGVEGHMELKYGKDKKVPSIRPSQVKWFAGRVKNGGHPIIFAKIIMGDVTRYCFYSGSRVRELYDAKTNDDWIRLADVIYTSEHWDIFLFKIKDMSRATAFR